MSTTRIALLLTLTLASFGVSAQRTTITAKSLIDGTGKVILNPVIVSEGERILANGKIIKNER